MTDNLPDQEFNEYDPVCVECGVYYIPNGIVTKGNGEYRGTVSHALVAVMKLPCMSTNHDHPTQPLPFEAFDPEMTCPQCGQFWEACDCAWDNPRLTPNTRCRCENWKTTIPEGSITCSVCGRDLFAAGERDSDA